MFCVYKSHNKPITHMSYGKIRTEQRVNWILNIKEKNSHHNLENILLEQNPVKCVVSFSSLINILYIYS